MIFGTKPPCLINASESARGRRVNVQRTKYKAKSFSHATATPSWAAPRISVHATPG